MFFKRLKKKRGLHYFSGIMLKIYLFSHLSCATFSSTEKVEILDQSIIKVCIDKHNSFLKGINFYN